MADNILGTKITDLEEAQAAGLTDDALLIVEPEMPPTKRSKLSTFFTWVKGKLAAWILSSYDEVMAATEAGYLVDALAVKDGFTQLNTKFVPNIPPDGTYAGTLMFTGSGYRAVFFVAPEVLDNFTFSLSSIDLAGVGVFNNDLTVERWCKNTIHISASGINNSGYVGRACSAYIKFTRKS